MIPELNNGSAVLSSIAFLFFLFGCLGYTNDEFVIKHTAWTIADDNGVGIYTNLQGIRYMGADEQSVLSFTVTAIAHMTSVPSVLKPARLLLVSSFGRHVFLLYRRHLWDHIQQSQLYAICQLVVVLRHCCVFARRLCYICEWLQSAI